MKNLPRIFLTTNWNQVVSLTICYYDKKNIEQLLKYSKLVSIPNELLASNLKIKTNGNAREIRKFSDNLTNFLNISFYLILKILILESRFDVSNLRNLFLAFKTIWTAHF